MAVLRLKEQLQKHGMEADHIDLPAVEVYVAGYERLGLTPCYQHWYEANPHGSRCIVSVYPLLLPLYLVMGARIVNRLNLVHEELAEALGISHNYFVAIQTGLRHRAFTGNRPGYDYGCEIRKVLDQRFGGGV